MTETSGSDGSVTEAQVVDRLRREGLAPASWTNGPHERYGGHEHEYDKVLVCVGGSIVFELDTDAEREPGIAERNAFELAAGDRLELPAGSRHRAVVGRSGVEMLECHLPAGSLDPRVVLRPKGEW